MTPLGAAVHSLLGVITAAGPFSGVVLAFAGALEYAAPSFIVSAAVCVSSELPY